MITLRRQTKVVPPKSSKSSKRPQKRTVPANSNLTEVDMNLITMDIDEEEPEPLDPRSDMAVSLVHGDILVLNGQNFEVCHSDFSLILVSHIDHYLVEPKTKFLHHHP